MVILVTGATGRVGLHFIPALLRKKEKVRVLVRDPEKARELWGDSVEIVQGDITDREAVMKAVDGVRMIYHMAALLDSDLPREVLFRTNVDGTRNVLDAGKGKRLIFVGSTAVFGKRVLGKAGSQPITESTEIAPTDAYGESKAEAERIAVSSGAMIIRPGHVYGPGLTQGIPRVLNLLSRGRMVIAGTGKNRLQWTHIDDLVEILLLAREKGRQGESYNVIGDEVMTQEEMVGFLAQLLGVPVPKLHVPMFLLKAVGGLFAKKSWIRKFSSDRVYDCSKAKREFGWKSDVSFRDGLKRMVEEYKARE